MKIFIATDLEGISGLCSEDQTFSSTGREYELARKYMAEDVNAAVEGALSVAQNAQVIVNDGHGRGYNMFIQDLHPAVELFSGELRQFGLDGLDKSVDLMFLIGYHAMSGSEGLLNHSMSSRTISRIWVNGKEIGEIFLSAAIAGEFGVPVGLVTGDTIAVKEAQQLLGHIETVAVKEPVARQSAKLLPVELARNRIREAAKRAVARNHQFKPFKVKPPVELKIEFILTQHAEQQMLIPGVVRHDARTLSYRGKNMLDAFRLLYF
ncbi:MAG: M55 family metallopeptidase [bacterium]|nr:M55 family metallopeptidase [bacterium]